MNITGVGRAKEGQRTLRAGEGPRKDNEHYRRGKGQGRTMNITGGGRAEEGQ